MTRRALILGAAGRDFHNFNTYFRDNPDYEVVAFTATQIPNIEGRKYPAELAGERYPDGIQIVAEDDLTDLIGSESIDVAVFSYSDVSHEHVMHMASRVGAAGADFMLLGPNHTMIESKRPVIAVCAARTGSGKSQTSRKIASTLKQRGKKVVVVRHPMPYGDLLKQAVQRFETYDDLESHDVTIEEREEYEPLIGEGHIVFAGVDYEAILRRAEEEADVVIWDGGNNDYPFYKPDLMVTVLDPHRPEHINLYHPGEINVRMADLLVINKVGTASLENVERTRVLAWSLNPGARIIEAASPVSVDEPDLIRGKRVLVVEDGPTLTHGEMSYGAGWIAARKFGAAEIVDPRPFAAGSIAETYEKYPTTGSVLPAMGYGTEQMKELAQTIEGSKVDLVVVGTPIDLGKLLDLGMPYVRVRYDLEEIGRPKISDEIDEFLGRMGNPPKGKLEKERARA